MQSGFLDVLNQSQVDRLLKDINTLQDWWIPRGVWTSDTGFAPNTDSPVDFYTLGVATYIDGISSMDQYYHYIKEQNPYFIECFGWLYRKVMFEFDKVIGQCSLWNSVAHPGFHVFSARPNRMPKFGSKMYAEKPSATIHVDLQHEKHELLFNNSFKDVDYENTLSFTLPLSVPKTGGGLNTWKDESMKQYEIDNEYTRHMKEIDYSQWGDYGEPTVVPYTAGRMFWFTGRLVHQIAPGFNLSFGDKRISLQGHGVKCDGTWILYF